MYRRTRIKMCGTTSLQDAERAVELGVDALGFIFVEKSARFIDAEAAREITRSLPPFLGKIGVFVDEGLTEIEEMVDYLGLNGIQLHGDEDPEFCRMIGRALPSCSVMKAVRVGQHTREDDFSPYYEQVNGFVLDTYVKDQEGGTGQVFDWNLIQELNIAKPYILAGGLNPDNIASALATVAPFAVDVNSGIEESPGVKDHTLLAEFVAQVTAFNINGQ